jgi:sortase A
MTATRPLPGPFAAPTRRPRLRPLLAGLALALGLAGTGLFVYPPVTDAYQGHLQTRLARQLLSPQLRRAYADRRLAVGASLTRMTIPAIGVRVVVVEGTTASALRAGAGHYPRTPLPGENGNVAIAGHRTTYGHPFTDLDQLHPGDDILLDTPVGSSRYRVTRPPFVVDKADWSPISTVPGRTLTLTTCHPKRSDRQRLIVRAALVPSGA